MPLPRQGEGGIDLATYTANYGLHQWEATDDFLRTDFNTDFLKIDTAIGGLLVFGSYTGNGTAGQTVNLGFTPRAVYTCTRDGKAGSAVGSGYCYGGLTFTGQPVMRGAHTAVAIAENGFLVNAPNDYVRTNLSGETYHYVAVK